MAGIDTDPFEEHESRPEEPTDTGENIPLIPGGSSTWEPERSEQETSFGGMSQRARLKKNYVGDSYKKLTKNIGETPETIHYNYFDFRGGELYYRGKNEPLTTKGKLKSVGTIAGILGKNRLRNLGFDIPRGKLTARQAVMLNEAQEALPSASDVNKVGDKELQEIVKNTEDLISHIQTQTDDLFEHALQELLGLDTHLRSIRGSLKVEVARKVQLEECIKKEQ